MSWKNCGLVVHKPFVVVHLYDHEGYHSSVLAPTAEQACAHVSKQPASKTLVATSLPFVGSWSQNGIDPQAWLPDVSMPGGDLAIGGGLK